MENENQIQGEDRELIFGDVDHPVYFKLTPQTPVDILRELFTGDQLHFSRDSDSTRRGSSGKGQHPACSPTNLEKSKAVNNKKLAQRNGILASLTSVDGRDGEGHLSVTERHDFFSVDEAPSAGRL